MFFRRDSGGHRIDLSAQADESGLGVSVAWIEF